MYRNVQVLRGVAAMLVVLGHLQPLFAQVHPWLSVVGLGRCGVDLFFVISGFVMVHTTRDRPSAPAAFALRRLARIVPLYWTVTVAVFGLALLAPALLGASRPDPMWLIKSLAFMPFDKGDGTFNPLVPVGWTLNYEVAFYGIFAVSLLIGGRARYALAAAAILLLSLPGWLGFEFASPGAQFYTRPIIAEFVGGIALGVALDRLPRFSSPLAAGAAVFGAGFALVVLLASGLASTEAVRVAVAGGSAVLVVGLALSLERGGRAAQSNAALAVGDASYSIYLTHLFVTQAFVLAAARLGIGGAPAVTAVIVAALLAVIGTGVLVHRFYERPATRLLRTAVHADESPARSGKPVTSP